MKIIGESMHIMNPAFLRAVEEKDRLELTRLARQQVDAGAQALDINLGGGRTLAGQTDWLIRTIQEEVDAELFISSHVIGRPEMLTAHRGTPTINAVTSTREDLVRGMDTALAAEADLVVLLVSNEITPTDVNGRLELTGMVMDTAVEAGMPLDRLYLDPVISCRPDPATWKLSAGLPDLDIIIDSIRYIREMSGDLKTIVALSNASTCLAPGKRSALHRRILPLLAAAGLDAVIMNCLDQKLMETARTSAMAAAA